MINFRTTASSIKSHLEELKDAIRQKVAEIQPDMTNDLFINL